MLTSGDQENIAAVSQVVRKIVRERSMLICTLEEALVEVSSHINIAKYHPCIRKERFMDV